MPALIVKLVRPRHFLFVAGTFLVTLGAAGAMGLLSSISSASFFNPPYWINWVHLTFGIMVLGIALAGGLALQNTMTLAPRESWEPCWASQACCSVPTPRTVTACRNLQTRPIISLISLSVCWRFGHGRTGTSHSSSHHRFLAGSPASCCGTCADPLERRSRHLLFGGSRDQSHSSTLRLDYSSGWRIRLIHDTARPNRWRVRILRSDHYRPWRFPHVSVYRVRGRNSRWHPTSTNHRAMD